MSAQQLSVAQSVPTETAEPTAAQLAARIEIPRRLPPRYDGAAAAAPLALQLHPIRALP